MEIICNNCGATIKDGDAFCGKCGTPVDRKVYCPSCGAEVEQGDSFCRKCGQRIPISSETLEQPEIKTSDNDLTVSSNKSKRIKFPIDDYNGELSDIPRVSFLFSKLLLKLTEMYENQFGTDIWFDEEKVKGSIKTWYRLLVKKKAVSKYPPAVEGEIVPDDEINGFIVLMDLHQFGFQEDVIVYYRDNGENEKIEFCKQSEISNGNNKWWDAYKEAPKFKNIPSPKGLCDNLINTNNIDMSDSYEQNIDRLSNVLTKEDCEELMLNYISVTTHEERKNTEYNDFYEALVDKKDELEAILCKRFSDDYVSAKGDWNSFLDLFNFGVDSTNKTSPKTVASCLIQAARRMSDVKKLENKKGLLPDLYEETSSFSITKIRPDFISQRFIRSLTYCAWQEYEGYVYYLSREIDTSSYHDEQHTNTLKCIRYKVGSGVLEEIDCVETEYAYQIIFRNEYLNHGRDSEYIDNSDNIYLSVREGKVVYSVTGFMVHIINLKNGEKKTIKVNTRSTGGINQVLSCKGDTIVYRIGNTYTRMDIDSEMSEKIISLKDKRLTGYTKDKLIFDNELVVDIFTGERKKISQLFPSTKNKTIFLVCLERGVVYYCDIPEFFFDKGTNNGGYEHFSQSRFAKEHPNYRETYRILGVDDAGEIVDVWHFPKLMESEWEEGYSDLSFDGRQMVVKMMGDSKNNGKTDQCSIRYYDREGNLIHHHTMKEDVAKLGIYLTIGNNVSSFICFGYDISGENCHDYNIIYDRAGEDEIKMHIFM